MMLNNDNLNETLADAVMDRPREFFIGEKRFCLWSPSLGMSLILARHVELLGIDSDLLSKNPSLEALRLVSKERKEICDVIAIHTFRKKKDLYNSKKINARSDFFFKNLEDSEIAKLLMLILSEPNAETLISLSPIKQQRFKQAQIAQIKKSSNTITFGGTTIYGSLIAPAMITLHLNFDEVVWGLSLINLKLLLADNINSVYLSDEDAKKLGILNKRPEETIGMTAEDFNLLKAEFSD